MWEPGGQGSGGGALQPQARVTRVGGEQGGRGRHTGCWEMGSEAARDLGAYRGSQCSKVTGGTRSAESPAVAAPAQTAPFWLAPAGLPQPSPQCLLTSQGQGPHQHTLVPKETGWSARERPPALTQAMESFDSTQPEASLWPGGSRPSPVGKAWMAFYPPSCLTHSCPPSWGPSE